MTHVIAHLNLISQRKKYYWILYKYYWILYHL